MSCGDVALGKIGIHGDVWFSDHKSTAEVWYKTSELGFKLPAGADKINHELRRPDPWTSGFDRSTCGIGMSLPITSWMDEMRWPKRLPTDEAVIDSSWRRDGGSE